MRVAVTSQPRDRLVVDAGGRQAGGDSGRI